MTPNGSRETAPNIIFVFFDNLGYGELGVYGGGVVRSGTTTIPAPGRPFAALDAEALPDPS